MPLFKGLSAGWTVLAAPVLVWQEANKVPGGRGAMDKASHPRPRQTDVQRLATSWISKKDFDERGDG